MKEPKEYFGSYRTSFSQDDVKHVASIMGMSHKYENQQGINSSWSNLLGQEPLG